MDPESSEEDYFAKLELVKEIRQKTVVAEKMKLNMKELMNDLHSEEKCLADYQTEIELLIQEKMAHVEELRLIHTDINTMENLAKQAKTARQRLVDEIKKAHEEFLPLKKELDEMRSAVGVQPLQEPESLNYVLKSGESSESEVTSSSVQPVPEPPALQLNLPSGPINCGKITLTKPTIRQQQPAPMKSCQSCHQLIHRNAPICPLCKAKSRSRNPKKARRKNEI
ncbi:zinc finger C4H2 domain-containing protein-like [Styela clava]